MIFELAGPSDKPRVGMIFHPARPGSQSQRGIWFILSAHIIHCNTLVTEKRKNSRAARAARILAQSGAVLCTATSWNI